MGAAERGGCAGLRGMGEVIPALRGVEEEREVDMDGYGSAGCVRVEVASRWTPKCSAEVR